MRQLDLFGSFFETPPQENKPEEKTTVLKKEEESFAAAPVAPSYSKNALRSERLVTNQSDTLEKAAEAAIKKQETPPADTSSLPPASPLLLSLFDAPFATEENDAEIHETEITLTETSTQAEADEEQIEQIFTTEVIKSVVANLPQEAIQIDEEPKETSFPSFISALEPEVQKKPAVSKANKQKAPELERTASVIFDDGKISVKIKNKSPFPAPIVKEKKEKVKKPLQKRGRKSFKEIDAEVDLIEIPEDEILFQKQYYAISEVAKWFRVNTSLLRFWENEFDVLKPRKNRKGDRLFRPEDVKNLQLIYQLLRQRKYTIEGAKEYIKTNKKKADIQLQLTNTLQKFKSFLLDLRANLQS